MNEGRKKKKRKRLVMMVTKRDLLDFLFGDVKWLLPSLKNRNLEPFGGLIRYFISARKLIGEQDVLFIGSFLVVLRWDLVDIVERQIPGEKWNALAKSVLGYLKQIKEALLANDRMTMFNAAMNALTESHESVVLYSLHYEKRPETQGEK